MTWLKLSNVPSAIRARPAFRRLRVDMVEVTETRRIFGLAEQRKPFRHCAAAARAPVSRAEAAGRAGARPRPACRCEGWCDGSGARETSRKPGDRSSEVMTYVRSLLDRRMTSAAESAVERLSSPRYGLPPRGICARPFSLSVQAPTSRIPSANTRDQQRIRIEPRSPVGQNGSSFTSASTTSALPARRARPPAGSLDNVRAGLPL
jgi:hypothetical protein